MTGKPQDANCVLQGTWPQARSEATPRNVSTSTHLFRPFFKHVRTLGPRPVRAAAVAVFSAALGLPSCGGSGSGPAAGITPAATSAEAGPLTKVVAVGSKPGAVVALFPDGKAFYSPDGFNLGGGGSSVLAYAGPSPITDIVPVAGGIDSLFADGSVYFSPDGRNLGGGGSTVRAADAPVAALIAVAGGVDAVLGDRQHVVFSPNGLNLNHGSLNLISDYIYAQQLGVSQIVPTGDGAAVVTLLEDGTAYYSPDNQHLGGGGDTIQATSADTPIQRLIKVGGGVLAEFNGGNVHLSPDGMNLAAGIDVPAWESLGNGPFAARDSAHGAAFGSQLWVSGGFADPGGSSCTSTCSFFDLWSSTDLSGTSWNSNPAFATATVPNPRDTDPDSSEEPRPTDFYDAYAAVIEWNGQLTAIGATVWRSADGVTWLRNNNPDGTPIPGPLPGRATENTRALELNGALYVLQPDSGEVFRSADANAQTWTDLGPIPGFTPRCGAAAFTLAGKIWLEGGGACDYTQVYNDMWSTSDGVTWTKSATAAAWHARMWACAAVSPDGVAWLATGYAPSDWNNTSGTPVVRYGANHAGVWYSKNGSDWRQYKPDFGSGLPDDGGLEPRHAPTCFVTGAPPDGMKLLIIAGSGGPSPSSFSARVLNSIRQVGVPAAALLP